MPTTTRLHLPYPAESDPADVPVDIQKLAEALDAGTGQASVAVDLQGLLNALPAPGVPGRYYWATDQGSLWRDDGASWRIIGPQPGDTKYSASGASYGWLLADGSAVARGGANAALFAAIGVSQGAGDGSATFNLPDLVGRAAIGAGQGAGLANRANGAKLGEENHRMVTAEMPSHVHSLSDPTHAHNVADPTHYHPSRGRIDHGTGTQTSVAVVGWTSQTDTTGPSGVGVGIYGAATGLGMYGAGGDVPHNNIQPSTALYPFVKL
jgi:microcystin-dependent protein